MAKLSTEELLESFKEMTLIELSEFVKKFEETFDVPPPPRCGGGGSAGGGAARPKPEKDEFDVILERRWQKIQVIMSCVS